MPKANIQASRRVRHVRSPSGLFSHSTRVRHNPPPHVRCVSYRTCSFRSCCFYRVRAVLPHGLTCVVNMHPLELPYTRSSSKKRRSRSGDDAKDKDRVKDRSERRERKEKKRKDRERWVYVCVVLSYFYGYSRPTCSISCPPYPLCLCLRLCLCLCLFSVIFVCLCLSHTQASVSSIRASFAKAIPPLSLLSLSHTTTGHFFYPCFFCNSERFAELYFFHGMYVGT